MNAGVRRRERGTAILAAMVIVTLVATLASAMVWQQWRAIQVEAADRARTQAAWVLNGAIDWARMILREDGRGRNEPDHLLEPWAFPLEEARLSTFIAADRDNADGAPEAFLSGRITDAQSRWNLRHLVEGNKIVEAELAVLRKLCETVQVSAETADLIAQAWKRALEVPSADDAFIVPNDAAQLAWLGVPADALARLLAYVVILPEPTPVNLNTAPAPVIAALTPKLDMALADRLVQARSRTPFKKLEDAQDLLPPQSLDGAKASVSSSFFEATGRLRLVDRVLEHRSLLHRRPGEVVEIYRERLPGSVQTRP